MNIREEKISIIIWVVNIIREENILLIYRRLMLKYQPHVLDVWTVDQCVLKSSKDNNNLLENTITYFIMQMQLRNYHE